MKTIQLEIQFGLKTTKFSRIHSYIGSNFNPENTQNNRIGNYVKAINQEVVQTPEKIKDSTQSILKHIELSKSTLVRK